MSRIFIAVADYYKEITDQLLAGVKQELGTNYEITTVSVPGAFELPAALHYALHGPNPYDGYIVLGCVIRGETAHFDYICQECARGLQELAMKHKIALGFGVLTVENREQAHKRADVEKGNKGREAARACLRMMDLKQQLMNESGA